MTAKADSVLDAPLPARRPVLELPTVEELLAATRGLTIEAAERALRNWRQALVDLVPEGRDRDAQKLLAGGVLLAGLGAAVTLGRVSGPLLGGAIIAGGVGGLNHAFAASPPKDGSRSADWTAFQRRLVAGSLAGVAAGASSLVAVKLFTTARCGSVGPVLVTAQSFAVRAMATSALLGQPVVRATGLGFARGSIAGSVAAAHVLVRMVPSVVSRLARDEALEERLRDGIARREVAIRYACKVLGAATGSGVVAAAVAALEPAACLALVRQAALSGAVWSAALNAGLSTAAYLRETRQAAGAPPPQRGLGVGDMGMDAADSADFGAEGAGGDIDLDGLDGLDDVGGMDA